MATRQERFRFQRSRGVMALRGGFAGLALVAVVGCSSDDPETIVGAAQEDGFEELIVGEPFEGTAMVTEVLSPHAFRLLDTLVVSADELDVTEDERVDVQGTVRDATIDELEEELGVDLGDEVADAHDGGLLVVAESILPVEFPGPEG